MVQINYKLNKNEIKVNSEDENLNYIFSTNTSNNNSWINFGILENTDKFQGQIIEHNENLKLYKTVEQIKFENYDKCKLINIQYNTKSIIKNFECEKDNKIFYQKTKYSKFNTIIFRTNNYEKELILELDCRELNDYDTHNRNYVIYHKQDCTIIRYTKENKYELYVAIENKNIKLNQIDKWIEKQYLYSKSRNINDKNLYTYEPISFTPKSDKPIYISSGFSEYEVLKNINLSKSKDYIRQVKETEISKNNKIDLAYNLSQKAVTTFKLKKGNKAGFFWFNQVWTRDELSSLNYQLENNEYTKIKKTLLKYLDLIGDCGLMPRIQEKGALKSPDGLFWFGKRLHDLIKELEQKNKLELFFKTEELETIFDKLDSSFIKLFDKHRNLDLDLLNVDYGDSWMDTVKVNFPLDVQIQLLSFMGLLEKISRILNNKSHKHNYIVLENYFKQNLKNKYFKNGYLYDNIENTRITANVFLMYYFYPKLFCEKHWEEIFDNTLPKLQTNWGGISSLDKENENFKDEYTGENNQSYHNGDSWYWINNLTGIVLNKLNKNK